MPGPMARAGFSHLLYPGLNQAYLLAFNEYPSEYDRFLNIDSSSKSKEEDLIIAGFGLLQKKTEGTQPYYDVMKMSDKREYVHDTYALGYEVTEELMEDELYNKIPQASKCLATAVKQTTDIFGSTVLNNSFNSAYAGVDGAALCSVNHPQMVAGGMVANKPAVDVDFDPIALQAALLTWETWTNDRGLPVLMKPKYVVSGPAQRDIITRTLGSTQLPGSTDNDINSLRDWNLEKSILHYLVDDDAWWIMSRPADHFLKWFWRIRPTFRAFDDPQTGNARYYVRLRASWGFTHWWGIYGSSGG